MLRNNIIRKIVKYRYLGYLAIGGFIISFLFINNFGFITGSESVTALSVSKHADTIAKTVPSIFGLVLLSIIAIFFILFGLHLRLKLRGLAIPLQKVAKVERSILTQLSVDSAELKKENKNEKEKKFNVPIIKPGETIEEAKTSAVVVAAQNKEDEKPESKKVQKENKLEKVKKKTSWFKKKVKQRKIKHKKKPEKKKQKPRVKKQKHKYDNYYDEVRSEFKELDKDLDNLLKRSGKI